MPKATDRVAGEQESEKSAGVIGFTVNAMVTGWLSEPLVPVTVTFVVPVAAVAEAASVSTVLVPVVLVGLKVVVTPVGSALVVKATEPAKPPVRVIVTVLVPLAPWLIDKLVGEAESEKSAGVIGLTVSAMVTGWLSDPLVPVTVTFVVPVVAVAEAASVNTVLAPVVLVGLKVAVTPVGSALVVKATAPVKPPVRVIVTVLVPLAPWLIDKLIGEAESEKSAGVIGVTVNATVTVWLSEPLVPVTVTFVIPVVAVADAASVNTVLAPVVLVGLKVAVTPLGRVLVVKATAPAKPPVRVIVTVLVPLAPWLIDKLIGEAESEKSAGVIGVTVNAIVTVWLSDPLVPVTVTLVVPAAAVADAASVNTVLFPVALAGLKLAVTPLGSALVVKATAPAKPPVRVIVTVLVPLAPWLIARLAGDAESVKSAGGGAPPAVHVTDGMALVPVTVALKPIPPVDPPTGIAPL
jgi:hypothetical protein